MCIDEQHPRAGQNTQHVLDKPNPRAGRNTQSLRKSKKLNNVEEVNFK